MIKASLGKQQKINLWDNDDDNKDKCKEIYWRKETWHEPTLPG